MKKILFLCVLLLALVSVRAQRVYFIYLQTENGTPFFIKMSDKVYSSTASGYLIVPKLKDSTYVFSVGKIGGSSGEPRFSVTISNNDKGFLIRESNKGLSLYNLQTMAVESPIATEVSSNTNSVHRTDAFTRLLAKAADDSTLLTVVYITKEEKKRPAIPETEKKVVVTETEPAKSNTTDNIMVVKEQAVERPVQQTNVTASNDTFSITSTTVAANKTDDKLPEKRAEDIPVKETATAKLYEEKKETASVKTEKVPVVNEVIEKEVKEYKRSTVIRRSESSTTEGFGLVFLDKNETATDTIRILIPNQKNVVRLVASETEKTKPVEVSTENTNLGVATIPAPKKEKLSCIYLGTENEFKRLRKAMAAKYNDESMLNEARRGFKNTCFTTEQIRNLSALFLTAEGKYSFFDIAYGHAVDSENYVSLGSEIKDDYYSRRFKALIGN